MEESKPYLATTDELLKAAWSNKLCIATTDELLEAVWSSKLRLATTDELELTQALRH